MPIFQSLANPVWDLLQQSGPEHMCFLESDSIPPQPCDLGDPGKPRASCSPATCGTVYDALGSWGEGRSHDALRLGAERLGECSEQTNAFPSGGVRSHRLASGLQNGSKTLRSKCQCLWSGVCSRVQQRPPHRWAGPRTASAPSMEGGRSGDLGTAAGGRRLHLAPTAPRVPEAPLCDQSPVEARPWARRPSSTPHIQFSCKMWQTKGAHVLSRRGLRRGPQNEIACGCDVPALPSQRDTPRGCDLETGQHWPRPGSPGWMVRLVTWGTQGTRGTQGWPGLSPSASCICLCGSCWPAAARTLDSFHHESVWVAERCSPLSCDHQRLAFGLCFHSTKPDSVLRLKLELVGVPTCRRIQRSWFECLHFCVFLQHKCLLLFSDTCWVKAFVLVDLAQKVTFNGIFLGRFTAPMNNFEKHKETETSTVFLSFLSSCWQLLPV